MKRQIDAQGARRPSEPTDTGSWRRVAYSAYSKICTRCGMKGEGPDARTETQPEIYGSPLSHRALARCWSKDSALRAEGEGSGKAA